MNAYASLSKDQAQQLAERLSWRYGPDRAREIVEGRDGVANRDLRLWARCGGTIKPKAESKTETFARIVRLYEQGVEVEHLAERFGYHVNVIDLILTRGGYPGYHGRRA